MMNAIACAFVVIWWWIALIPWSQAFSMNSSVRCTTITTTSWIHNRRNRRFRPPRVLHINNPSSERDEDDRTTTIQQQQQQHHHPHPPEENDYWTGDPYLPVAYPSYRLDLTPASKLPTSSTSTTMRRLSWELFGSLYRRLGSNNNSNNNNVTYYDETESSTSIMAKLWKIVVMGRPITVVFPRAKYPITIRQFVDLLHFLHQHDDDHDHDVDDKHKNAPLLVASYETIFGFPAIRFVQPPPPTPPPSAAAVACVQPPPPRQQKNKMTTTSKNNYYPSPKTMERRLQAWVKRVLVQLQICPFTKSVKYSGQGVPNIPVAKIAYRSSHATTVAQVMADCWEAMEEMLVAGPMEISSILLAVPHFDHQFRLWAGPVFTVLEHSVIAAQATNALGVVCFHPKYQTPDGTTFPGFGHMHSVTRLQRWCSRSSSSNSKGILLLSSSSEKEEEDERGFVAAGGAWQRRTPHAVINVLRADQLVAAEPLRNTPQLYRENIQKLLAMVDELPIALAREQQLE